MHVRQLQRFSDILADLREDRLRRACGRHDTKPGIVLVAGHTGLDQRRRIRKLRQALGGIDSKHPQPSGGA